MEEKKDLKLKKWKYMNYYKIMNDIFKHKILDLNYILIIIINN